MPDAVTVIEEEEGAADSAVAFEDAASPLPVVAAASVADTADTAAVSVETKGLSVSSTSGTPGNTNGLFNPNLSSNSLKSISLPVKFLYISTATFSKSLESI
ncbi:unnamed protein product [[Candida] boidinii]|nr:unnamed protein product [[Candida] boidinii]